MSLSDASIFHTKQVLKNFNTKKSAFVNNQTNEIQILCLVNDCDEILIHYTFYDAASCQQQPGPGQEKRSSDFWKLIVWFHNNGKLIQDLCFDPEGTKLLVVCYDNTLHIVPILWILNPNAQQHTDQEAWTSWPFRFDEITSFVIPFSGPHECPNPRTCPNNNKNIKKRSAGNTEVTNREQNHICDDIPENFDEKYSPEHENKEVLSESSNQTDASPLEEQMGNVEICSDEDSDIGVISDPVDLNEHQNCPYPMSVVWWTTSAKFEGNQIVRENRVILGYSDGSICVVCKWNEEKC